MVLSPAPPPVPWAALAWIVRDWMLITTAVLAAFICITCCRKKKPVEDLMAKPKFNPPVTVAPKTKTLRQQPVDVEKPVVEHTVSIKLDNNADEDDLKGPRESMSKDPMTDVPVPAPRNKGINEFKSEHDKETNTPPSNKKRDKTSKSKEDNGRVPEEKSSVRRKKKKGDDAESTKKAGKTMEEKSVSKKRKTKSKPKNTKDTKDEKQKKTTIAITTCEGNLDVTQEAAPSAEDAEQKSNLLSAKEGTTMSFASTRKKTASSKAKKKGTPTKETKDMDATQDMTARTRVASGE